MKYVNTTAKDARERVAVILRSRAVCAVAAGSVGTFTATELLALANELDPEHAVSMGAVRGEARKGEVSA